MEETYKLLITKKNEPVKRALLIGINYFGQNGELSGCQNDIANVETYLRACGYTDFTVLKDDPRDPKFLSPSAPTKANIIRNMRDAIAKTRSGDVLYVHYSGHGSHISDALMRDEKDDQDECICPVDYARLTDTDSGFIRDDTLNQILVKNLAPKAKLRVCFDSCHSGSALDLPIRWDSTSRFKSENTDFSAADVVFISGCQDEQTSADSSFNGRAAGAMTWALLSALWDIKKSGRAWTWKELVQMMRMNLKKEQYSQVPQMGLESSHQIAGSVDLI